MKKEISAIIMSAGKSKRMKTRTSKVLHKIMGKKMIDYVVGAVNFAGIPEEKIVLVVGHKKELLIEYLGDKVQYAHQDQQLGTGHAVMQALPLLEEFHGDILIHSGDMPLLRGESILSFIKEHQKKESKISILTAVMPEPGKLGRIVRNHEGNVERIVEAVDSKEEELKIKEVNTGCYLLDADYLRELIPHMGLPNAQNEIYLTDTVLLSRQRGVSVSAVILEDWRESMGVNCREDLAILTAIMRERINKRIMSEGVTLHDPSNTYIDEEVEIAMDTEILPNTIIKGKTVIGESCIIGPNSYIVDSHIGDNVTVMSSVVLQSRIGDDTWVGPYAHLRPESYIAENVKIGNFVEIKKSTVDQGSKIPHLSYIGDTTMGKKVNIGAGTITCNFDGVKKNPTFIGDHAYIGANTNLVAPIAVGEGGKTGAGTVATKNIPEWTLMVGLPGRNIKKLKKPLPPAEQNKPQSPNRDCR